ncbi:MAG: Hsp20/alpha crystallin family protein [Kiritimatiellae bacterium]|nr:Hsp20/alpha crystallin family protein [Kiritimatiellia bacterium]
MIGLTRWERHPWSIFDELESLQHSMNRAFSDLGLRGPAESPRLAYPALNIWGSEEGVIIDAELPGVEAKDVDISVMNDELTLRGKVNVTEPEKGVTCHRQERESGTFSRTIRLPFRANTDAVSAKYENGILRIRVPRPEEEKPKQIAIEAA